jgi:hypothetical protein
MKYFNQSAVHNWFLKIRVHPDLGTLRFFAVGGVPGACHNSEWHLLSWDHVTDLTVCVESIEVGHLNVQEDYLVVFATV